MASTTGTAASVIAAGKDLLALLRDFSVFALAVLLVAFPGTLNDVLTRAGFEEGSLVGFKWKSKLVEADTALKEARATISDLRAQLDKTTQALGDGQAKLNDASKQDLARLYEQSRQLTSSASRVEAAVATTIAANAPLVEKAQAAVSGDGAWGIVFGADATLPAAKHEVEAAARKHGIPNASIYLRQGSYRSVSVVVEGRAQAEQTLAKARQLRPDAYIVNMASWCPRSIVKEGYRECAPPGRN